jgi:hypothetical protein
METSKPSLIRINLGAGEVKVAIKHKNKLITQINGKFSDVRSDDENMTVQPLFKNYKKTIHLFIDRRLRSCTCFLNLIMQV